MILRRKKRVKKIKMKWILLRKPPKRPQLEKNLESERILR